MLGALRSRCRAARDQIAELWRHGAPALDGDPSNGTVFLIDGVGGLYFGPMLARRAFRQARAPFATRYYDWHRGIRGDLLSDLVWRRLNLRAALRLARLMRQTRRQFPEAPIHVLAYSGGTGIAAFAIERLSMKDRIGTVVLCCSALSPGYSLSPMLQKVQRAYAFHSRKDRMLLGIGTCLFGTIDRRFGRAAGLRGFHPTNGQAGYAKLTQIWWDPDTDSPLGHCGHHTGTMSVAFIRERIVPLLLGSQ